MQQVLRGKRKSSFTTNILGIHIDTYRKKIECQMTPEMNWSIIEIDHVKSIGMFEIPKDEEPEDAFNWKNTQPLLKHNYHQIGIKYKF